VAGGLLFALAVAAYSIHELARFERAELARTVFVEGAGQVLAPGLHVRLVDLAGTLGRLGYTETRASPALRGQFRRGPAAWEVVLRDGSEGALSRIRLEIQDERVFRVTRDGHEVRAAELEGEVLTGGADYAGEDHRPVRLSEVPKSLVGAVLAAEDRRFYTHGALDGRGLARAAWANLYAGRVSQGGSTLTQQLVKNRLLTPHRSVIRKAREAWLAVLVEWRYSKDQILEAYLNEIYLGQRGALAIRGVGAASRAYFAKEVHQLSPGEAALLAGMIRAPNTHSPVASPARARARRDQVLVAMRTLAMIDEAARRRASAEPVRALTRPHPGQTAPYFTDHVRQELEERFGEGALRSVNGARIVTTLDPALQRFAENAVARGLDRVETRLPALRRRDPRARLQVALVALDPATGEIRAFVGGRDYQTSQFNRGVAARRQPGSAFKPFVYLAALRGAGGPPALTAASLVDDAPITVMVGGKPWSPRNHEDRYEGRVSVRRAFEQSLNAATVRVAQAVGPAAVIETARSLGLRGDLKPVPALALGAFEVSPLELARAWVPLANGGLRPGAVTAVRAVRLADGTALAPVDSPAAAQVLSPAEAYLMTSLLQGVMRTGTGAPAQAFGIAAEVAGKTGTTNDGRDAWFVGYAANLLTVTWVGFDDGTPLAQTGAQAALPIWADFMRQALDAYPSLPFATPPGISVASIDPTTGRRATEHCPLVAREVFLTGTEPAPCEAHHAAPDPALDWWQRLRGWFAH
jgi:penicillin-binding protein 1B